MEGERVSFWWKRTRKVENQRDKTERRGRKTAGAESCRRHRWLHRMLRGSTRDERLEMETGMKTLAKIFSKKCRTTGMNCPLCCCAQFSCSLILPKGLHTNKGSTSSVAPSPGWAVGSSPAASFSLHCDTRHGHTARYSSEKQSIRACRWAKISLPPTKCSLRDYCCHWSRCFGENIIEKPSDNIKYPH